MVILIVGEFGNNISMAMWSSQDGNKFYLTFGIQFFIIKNSTACWLCTLTILEWLGQLRTWKRHGQAFELQSTLAIRSHMTDTWDACIGNSRVSGCPKKLIRLRLPLKPRRQQQHNIELRTGGSMMKTTRHGSDIMCNLPKDSTSRVMRGESSCQNSSRITFFDKKLTLKGCPTITDGNNQGGYQVYTDD